jgi:release factor glutamine methyltransferase
MKPLGEVLQLSTQFLKDRNVENPRRLAEELLAHLLHCKRIDLYMRFDCPLEEGELSLLRDFLKRASRGEPVEYIQGEIPFFGSVLKVDRRALIPRVETEFLVELVEKRIGDRKRVWDVCTGSGCIGIALKKKRNDLEVSLSDLSQEALDLAAENSRKNGVDVVFYQGDLLSPFQGKLTDVIVCNPPYVSTSEFFALDPSVRDFEPKTALLGGDDGLDFYRRLSFDVDKYLNPKGLLFLEIGYLQGKQVQEIFNSPVWMRRELISDLSGKDRFFFLEKQ